MAVPGSTFNWIDNSQIAGIPEVVTPASTARVPTFLACVSSDRGPEDARMVQGSNFYKLYGADIQFRKHGQPLLNAATIINNGGRLFVKRVVAEDSTLANSIIVANVKVISTQKVDTDGNNLYLNDDGEETTEVTTTPAMSETAQVTYETYSISDVMNPNISSLDAAIEKIAAVDGEEDDFGDIVYRYPLFAVSEIGRGPSTKRYRIVPDYTNSKNQKYMFYDFMLYYDADNNYESVRFCVNPDVIFSEVSMNLTTAVKRDISQASAKLYDDYVNAYAEKISQVTGISTEELINMDILFGATRKGVAIEGLEVNPVSDEVTIDLNAVEGISLEEGSNGSFGDAPYGTDLYFQKVHEFFSGEATDEIYNLDNYRIDIALDANYPDFIKRDLEILADYRKDFLYMGDLGYLTTYEEIAEAYEIDNVLTQASNGDIKKRDTDYLLKDIGGCSYSMDDSSGILSLKLGK